jgi:hypothetical protein
MEAMNYFDWTFNSESVPDLFLGEPRLPSGDVVDAWKFKQCERLAFEADELSVHADRLASMSNMCFGAFDLPYATPALANALSHVTEGQVQWIPVRVQETGTKLYLLNALREVACIDERRSKFSKWEPGNTSRPDKAGQYKAVSSLYVEPRCIDNVDVLRPWGWRVVLVVSERVKRVAESLGVEGTTFLPVT